MNLKSGADYSLITERPDAGATQEQITRLYQRYHFARQFAENKDVLEAACGSGIGLGYLAKAAGRTVGGDIDEKNVSLAKEHYRNRAGIQIGLMDAHNLPFADAEFDLVLLYEAIYYLKSPEQFAGEAARVLRKEGKLIVCTVNKDWEDFHPSPYACRYFSVPELSTLLKKHFPEVVIYGAFPVTKGGIKDSAVSLIKRTAVAMNLIPGSLKARTYLKRIFIGKLTLLPAEIYEGMACYQEPVPTPSAEINRNFKIIYGIAAKN